LLQFCTIVTHAILATNNASYVPCIKPMEFDRIVRILSACQSIRMHAMRTARCALLMVKVGLRKIAMQRKRFRNKVIGIVACFRLTEGPIQTEELWIISLLVFCEIEISLC
jgi:hypothetical protein